MNAVCKQGRYNKLLCRMINDDGNTLFRKCWYDSIQFNTPFGSRKQNSLNVVK